MIDIIENRCIDLLLSYNLFRKMNNQNYEELKLGIFNTVMKKGIYDSLKVNYYNFFLRCDF